MISEDAGTSSRVAASKRNSATRWPGLDVLRGIAILLVLVRHSWPETFGGAGAVGVVLFFTLSGYLITGVIMRDITQTHSINFRRFYAHRAFRLLPALVLLLSVFSLTELMFNHLGDEKIVWQSVFASLFYLNDFPLPFDTSVAVNHLWTLAIEEQFYLLWPFLLVSAARRNRITRLLVASIVTLLLVCAISVALTYEDPARIYILPSTWASAMVMGAAAQLHAGRLRGYVAKSASWAVVAAVSIGMLAALSMWQDAKDSPIFYLVAGPTIALGTVGLIFTVGAMRVLPGRALEPLRLLGLVSYAVYLWNPLVMGWLHSVEGLYRWVDIPVTIAAGVVSWFTAEALGRRWRSIFDNRAASRSNRRMAVRK